MSGRGAGGALIRGRGMNGQPGEVSVPGPARDLGSLRAQVSVFYYKPDTEEELIITPEVELVVFRQSDIRMTAGWPIRSHRRGER